MTRCLTINRVRHPFYKYDLASDFLPNLYLNYSYKTFRDFLQDSLHFLPFGKVSPLIMAAPCFSLRSSLWRVIAFSTRATRLRASCGCYTLIVSELWVI